MSPTQPTAPPHPYIYRQTGGGGGGHCLLEGRYRLVVCPLPSPLHLHTHNYRHPRGGGTASLKVATHCQTTTPTFQGSQLSLTAPCLLGDYRPLKSYFPDANYIRRWLQFFHRTLGLMPSGTMCHRNLFLDFYPIHKFHVMNIIHV